MSNKLFTEDELRESQESGGDFEMEANGVKLETHTVTEEGRNPFTEEYYAGKLEELQFTRKEVCNTNERPSPAQIPYGLYKRLCDVGNSLNLMLIRSRNERKGHLFYQVGLIKVSADNSWEPVEVAEHKLMSEAGLALLMALHSRGFTNA